MALPKIDFDQNDHDHFDHDAGAFSIKPAKKCDLPSAQNTSQKLCL